MIPCRLRHRQRHRVYSRVITLLLFFRFLPFPAQGGRSPLPLVQILSLQSFTFSQDHAGPTVRAARFFSRDVDRFRTPVAGGGVAEELPTGEKENDVVPVTYFSTGGSVFPAHEGVTAETTFAGLLAALEAATKVPASRTKLWIVSSGGAGGVGCGNAAVQNADAQSSSCQGGCTKMVEVPVDLVRQSREPGGTAPERALPLRRLAEQLLLQPEAPPVYSASGTTFLSGDGERRNAGSFNTRTFEEQFAASPVRQAAAACYACLDQGITGMVDNCEARYRPLIATMDEGVGAFSDCGGHGYGSAARSPCGTSSGSSSDVPLLEGRGSSHGSSSASSCKKMKFGVKVLLLSNFWDVFTRQLRDTVREHHAEIQRGERSAFHFLRSVLFPDLLEPMTRLTPFPTAWVQDAEELGENAKRLLQKRTQLLQLVRDKERQAQQRELQFDRMARGLWDGGRFLAEQVQGMVDDARIRFRGYQAVAGAEQPEGQLRPDGRNHDRDQVALAQALPESAPRVRDVAAPAEEAGGAATPPRGSDLFLTRLRDLILLGGSTSSAPSSYRYSQLNQPSASSSPAGSDARLESEEDRRRRLLAAEIQELRPRTYNIIDPLAIEGSPEFLLLFFDRMKYFFEHASDEPDPDELGEYVERDLGDCGGGSTFPVRRGRGTVDQAPLQQTAGPAAMQVPALPERGPQQVDHEVVGGAQEQEQQGGAITAHEPPERGGERPLREGEEPHPRRAQDQVVHTESGNVRIPGVARLPRVRPESVDDHHLAEYDIGRDERNEDVREQQAPAPLEEQEEAGPDPGVRRTCGVTFVGQRRTVVLPRRNYDDLIRRPLTQAGDERTDREDGPAGNSCPTMVDEDGIEMEDVDLHSNSEAWDELEQDAEAGPRVASAARPMTGNGGLRLRWRNDRHWLYLPAPPPGQPDREAASATSTTTVDLGTELWGLGTGWHYESRNVFTVVDEGEKPAEAYSATVQVSTHYFELILHGLRNHHGAGKTPEKFRVIVRGYFPREMNGAST